jgi:RimJ/RimL family protein N-acetyltransferase
MMTHITGKGDRVEIRPAVESDAEGIIAYATLLFASTDQVLTTPEEYVMTIEDEKKWINGFAKQPAALLLVAEYDGKVVGLLDFCTRPRRKAAHSGELGISVHPDYQGQGIGKTLLSVLLDWAKEHKQVEKVFLNVFATNAKAIALYKKLGFIEECRQVNAIKQPTGEYIDLIQMYIDTR